jgi:ATP-dependent Lon protease
VATGLAWTQYGGEVLAVESMAVPGRGGLMLTGTLGKVMQESANIAYTYVRDRAKQLNLPPSYFDRNIMHLHVPAGATPKDGPSAGVTMVASLYSLLAGRALKPGIAMTGEITLSGRVLPVGGIKEKLLAARRAQMHTVLLPRANERDLREIEPEIKAGLTLVKLSTVDDVLRRAF